MRRPILLLLACLTISAVRAEALTLKEVLDLHKAGLSDDVLVALIEVEKSVFAIDHETIKMMKAEGLSERVMIAMIKSGRMPAPPSPQSVAAGAPAAAAPAPQVVVIEHQAPPQEPVVTEVAVPVPVYVAVPLHGTDSRRHKRRVDRQVVVPQQQLNLSPPNLPLHMQAQPNLPIHMQPKPKKVEPVYWGWGGKLRPDAWKPARDK
jgi:hypothetical protein